jgi:hypothetical protein
MAFKQHGLGTKESSRNKYNLLDQAKQLDKPYISERCRMHLLAHQRLQISDLRRPGYELGQQVGLGAACRRKQLSARRGPAPVTSIAGPSFESIDSDDFLSPVTTLVSLLWFYSCGLLSNETCNRAFHAQHLVRWSLAKTVILLFCWLSSTGSALQHQQNTRLPATEHFCDHLGRWLQC